MEDIQLQNIERELKKRWYAEYAWGRRQNDVWDKFSNFIYEVEEWEELVERAAEVSEKYNTTGRDFQNYCYNRWYNYLSAKAIEKIFCSVEGIKPVPDKKDRLKDFNFFGINFDHKTTIFPKGYGRPLSYAQKNPVDLILWLYSNQSSQQRQHFFNRLFLVVYAQDGQHWKLKAEIFWLKKVIEKYVATFDPSQLRKLEFQKGEPVFSDIIWAIK